MKKKMLTAVCTAWLSATMAMPAFAGQWVSDSTGWWWKNDDGSYPVSTWQWLDGNQDGVAECYYFNADGYMLARTTTPDGYTVNENGAWMKDGAVQTQAAAPAAVTQEQTGSQTASDMPDVLGTYVGTYDGQQITALFEEYDGTIWAEVDFFLKDMLPPYKGNGLFEDSYNSFQFSGNSLVFTDTYTGETIQFVKQS